MAQWVKNLPAMQETQETWVWSLSWEDPLEKETHSGIMAWKILWTEEPERLQPLELQRAGHDWITNTHLWTTRRSNQPEHQGSPRGNQPWILIGRTDAEAPILWPPDAKSQLIGKYPDAGKDWRQEDKRATEEATVGWHHRLDGYDSKFQETVKDMEALCAAVHGVAKSWTRLSNWTITVFGGSLFSLPHWIN